MKLLVLGPTGKTGGHLLTQALDAGHDVTALARTPGKITISRPRLRVVQGDALDAASIEAAMPGHEAVLSALGVASRGPTTVYSQGVANIQAAMQATGVRRLICISSGGIEIGPQVPIAQRLVIRHIVQRVYRHPYADMRRMEDALQAGPLDWTVIRAPMLTDGPRTRDYRFSSDRPLPDQSKISRADLADFILTHLTDTATYRTRVDISN
ncbi:SDR family oxidoreductase [Spirillospora sp. NPDC048819]|uniref:NAD(P)-dependent oxidoreductase n=1 Tax=Spirillospora sp. NPDC048819 TaxID=3155268 RepID=UPI0033E239B5